MRIFIQQLKSDRRTLFLYSFEVRNGFENSNYSGGGRCIECT